MARDDDGDGVPCQSLPNVSGCGGLAQSFGKLAVGAAFACGDFTSGFVHLPGKGICSVQVHSDVAKILKLTLEVLADFPDDLGNGRRSSGVATLHTISRDPELALAQLLPGLVAALRGLGCTRLQVYALRESLLAAELRRAGFFSRPETVSVLGLPLTEAGDAVVRSPRQWEITQLDCDR